MTTVTLGDHVTRHALERLWRYDTAMLPLLALLIGLLAVSVNSSQMATLTAHDLTAPADSLPDDCELKPAPTSDGKRLPLGVPTNPWIGADAVLAGRVRAMVEGAASVADGSRERLRTAGDISDAYAAFYDTASVTVIAVFAVRLNAPPDRLRSHFDANHLLQVGPFVLAHGGDGGECHQAVVRHLESLMKR